MIPVKPYFVRAFYDWIVDNGWTPHLLVDATMPDVVVPREFVKDGKIVLNVIPRAIRELSIENEWIRFHTRFAGESFHVQLPMNCVAAIYAMENGESLTFPTGTLPPEPSPEPPESPKPSAKPGLRVVK